MQQINLYSYLPHPVKSLLDARALLVLFGAYCVMLFFIYGVGIIEKQHDNNKLLNATARVKTATQRLTSLAAEYPTASTTKTPNLAKLAYCKFKFTTLLQGIADAIVPGVWLTAITIGDHGRTLSIKGHALIEGQAQLYVEQLNNQDIFGKTPLMLQNITRADAEDKNAPDALLDFRISTMAAQNNG